MKFLSPIIFAIFILSGCSTTSTFTASAFTTMVDGPCTAQQEVAVSDHLSGQIDALAKQDWDLAYTFAAESFREGVSLTQFTQVIEDQYQMLITNTGYSFSECLINSGRVTQEVRVDALVGNFILVYELSVVDQGLGVTSALVSDLAVDLNL